jgi:hypothetical protein
MLSLANEPDRLKITVHCMGPSAADRAKSWLPSDRGNSIIASAKKGDSLNGSRGHAACVMAALEATGDGNIHIICDSDTVVVAKGWDDYIRKRMVDDEVGIMGTTYEDLGGFSSGASAVQTYKKVPSLTWCVLSPMHNWRDLTVMPNKSHQVSITSPQLSQIYNLPQGYSVFGEVGWQLPQYVYDHALTYDGWRQLKPSKDAVILKGLSDYHEEYHVDGEPFVVHHRGSMRHAYRGDKISRQFYSAVDDRLATELSRPPRWSWQDTGKKLEPVAPPAKPIARPPIEVKPEEFVPTGKEWLKVTFNGNVLRARRGVDRTVPGTELEFERPDVDRIGHLRVEGVLEHNYPIVVPPVTAAPYMLTVRNAAGAPLLVTCGRGGHVAVPCAKTWWLLVDVDGVQRVE